MPVLDNSVSEEKYKDDSDNVRATWAAYSPVFAKRKTLAQVFILSADNGRIVQKLFLPYLFFFLCDAWPAPLFLVLPF